MCTKKNKFILLCVVFSLLISIFSISVNAESTTAKVDVGKKAISVTYNEKTTKLKRVDKELHLRSKLNIYSTPDFTKKAGTIKKYTIVKRVAKIKSYSIIKYKKKYYFVNTKNIKTVKTVIKWRKFKRQGVVRYNHKKFTYYSQRVLPGRGLKIPGRHVDKLTNCVCDKDGYIVLGSTIANKKKHIIVPTPLGKLGKVYDCGGGTSTLFDIYCNW